MAKIGVLLAEGLEEVECLAVVDMLRRGSQQVEMLSVMGEKTITGSHGIGIVCDGLLEEAKGDWDLLFLPGGIPGVPNLENNPRVREAVKAQAAAGKYVAAICAAPMILGHLGLLDGKAFTCYPGCEKEFDGKNGARWSGAPWEQDGKILTGRGVGVAIDFGLKLLAVLAGEEAAESVKSSIQHPERI